MTEQTKIVCCGGRRDRFGSFQEEKEQYHAYIQNMDGGVYLVIAKEMQVVR